MRDIGTDFTRQVPGSNIPECIEALSLSFGVARAVSTPTGSTRQREASDPSISEVVFTKRGDIASAPLFIEAVVGRAAVASIHVLTPASTLQLQLDDVLVSGLDVSADELGAVETVSLNFTRIGWRFTAIRPDGTPAAPILACYDIRLGRRC